MSAAHKILIVEDNDITRKLIVGILRNNGYDTLEATDGFGALRLLDSKPSLILLDIQMEPLGGFGFMKKANVDDGFKTPVVLITADDGADVLMEAARHRIRHVLAKPIEPEKLLNMVAAILARSGLAVPAASNPALPAAGIKPQEYMRRAIDLSRDRMQSGYGGPFGAVIVKGGQIVGEGWNAVTSSNDPTAHAEVMAIRNACRSLGTFNLQGCEIYTSCEPCPMCLSAIYWARLDKIWFANTHADAAAIDFDDSFIYEQIAQSPEARSIPRERLMAGDALEVFRQWAAKTDKTPY